MSVLVLALVLAAACVAVTLVTRAVSGNWASAIVALILVGVVAVITFTGQYFANYHNDKWVTCHVTDKDRGGQDGTYRVYTDDCGVFGNRDSWFRFKTNSADVQQSITVGQTYRLHVAGVRFGPRSWFPNILDVQKVDG